MGGQIDDIEGSAVRHDEVTLMLRRDDGQTRGELPNVLAAARARLIDEPAVEDDAHGACTKQRADYPPASSFRN